jgi:hypothetical protein
VPLLGIAIFLTHRNSLRGRLLLVGLLFYFFYVYLMTATGNSFNPLFLVYIAIFALSAVAFFINLFGIDVQYLSGRVSSRFPRRLFIGFTFIVAATLTFLWLGRIIPMTLSNRFPPEFAGLSTLVSQALDLGLIVPVMVCTGILLWRQSPWGYLLTGISLGYGLMMSITLPSFIVVPLIQDGQATIVEAIPFSVVSLAGLYLAGTFFRSVHKEPYDGEQPAVGTIKV